MYKKLLLVISLLLVATASLMPFSLGLTASGSPRINQNSAKAATACADGSQRTDRNYIGADGKKTTNLSSACYSEYVNARKSDGDVACKSVSISWLICPFINLVSDGVEKAEGFILNLLVSKPLDQNPNQNTAVIYQLWTSIRDVANALLVLVFLIMIVGNSVAIGVDAYTVKRTLPRLVIAAVLIQFSFAICKFLIDFINVIGLAIIQLGNNALTGATGISNTVTNTSTAIGVVGIALLAGAVISAISSGAGFILILGALIAAIGTLITLALRQLMILVLVIASPLAILAWVLPNTEKLFKTWSTNFIKILFMFPLIAALFVVAKVGASIAASDSGTINDLLSFMLIIIPLFAVPFTFKWAGGMMAASAGAISKIAQGRSQAIKNSQGAKDFLARRQALNERKAIEGPATFGGKAKRAYRQMGAYGAYQTTVGRVAGKGAREKFEQTRYEKGAAARENERARSQSILGAKGAELEAFDFSGTTEARLANEARFGAGRVREIEASIASAGGYSEVRSANDLYGIELEKVAKGQKSTVLGVSSPSRELQTAAITEMAKRGDYGEAVTDASGAVVRDASGAIQYKNGIRSVLQSGVNREIVMEGLGTETGKVAGEAPDIVKGDIAASYSKLSAEKIAGLDKTSAGIFAEFIRTASPEDKEYLESELRKLHDNEGLTSKLGKDVKEKLNKIAEGEDWKVQEKDAAGDPKFETEFVPKMVTYPDPNDPTRSISKPQLDESGNPVMEERPKLDPKTGDKKAIMIDLKF